MEPRCSMLQFFLLFVYSLTHISLLYSLSLSLSLSLYLFPLFPAQYLCSSLFASYSDQTQTGAIFVWSYRSCRLILHSYRSRHHISLKLPILLPHSPQLPILPPYSSEVANLAASFSIAADLAAIFVWSHSWPPQLSLPILLPHSPQLVADLEASSLMPR